MGKKLDLSTPFRVDWAMRRYLNVCLCFALIFLHPFCVCVPSMPYKYGLKWCTMNNHHKFKSFDFDFNPDAPDIYFYWNRFAEWASEECDEKRQRYQMREGLLTENLFEKYKFLNRLETTTNGMRVPIARTIPSNWIRYRMRAVWYGTRAAMLVAAEAMAAKMFPLNRQCHAGVRHQAPTECSFHRRRADAPKSWTIIDD